MARAWSDAHRSLAVADEASALGAEDLELLATAAYMLGRDEEYAAALERAHQAHLDAGEPLARCAARSGSSLTLLLRGELGRATGWLGRAQRLLEREDGDCVERGYLLVPVVARHEIAGDYEAAHAPRDGRGRDRRALRRRRPARARPARAGPRAGRAGPGRRGPARCSTRRWSRSSAGELSPIVTGLVYCSVIDGCQAVYELRRAQEWTAALTRWCERAARHGRLHRPLPGAPRRDHAAARRLGRRAARGAAGRRALAHVSQAAAARRSTGRARSTACRATSPAEEAYRARAAAGREPQPGLALLRLAQGSGEAAAAAIRRVAAGTAEPLERARLLPASVEIMLAAGDADAARAACGELEGIAARLRERHARAPGRACPRSGRPRRRGRRAPPWSPCAAPGSAGRSSRRRTRRRACASSGPGVPRARRRRTRPRSSSTPPASASPSWGRRPTSPASTRCSARAGAATHGLTPRELEVLRLVAAGETNKAIAAELVLSERTVDRHVSNIFAKLGASSRSRGDGLRVPRTSSSERELPTPRARRQVGWFRAMRAAPGRAECRRHARIPRRQPPAEALLAGLPVAERRLDSPASRPPCWRAATARRWCCCTGPAPAPRTGCA